MTTAIPATHLQFTHELDAAWIIALWKAIHGGDPAPERVAAQAIAALATVVAPPVERAASFEAFQKQFGALGATVKGPTVAEAQSTNEGLMRRQYCFTFKGHTYCTELPSTGPHTQQ